MRKEKLGGRSETGDPHCDRELLTRCRMGVLHPLKFRIQPLSGEVRQLLRIDKSSDRGRKMSDYSNVSQPN